jgi:hypothetical protein
VHCPGCQEFAEYNGEVGNLRALVVVRAKIFDECSVRAGQVVENVEDRG